MTAPLPVSLPSSEENNAPSAFAGPIMPFAGGSAESDPTNLLEQIMPRARLALWDAWDDPLELVSLNFGGGNRGEVAIAPCQAAPGTPWNENVYPPDREKLRVYLDSAAATKSVDYRLIVGEGELLWIRHWIYQQSRGSGGRRRLRGLIMAIPEQKHSEWECLRVSERECNRIGQELHDDLCQVLAGLSFMMRVIGQRAAKLAPELGAEVDELTTHLVGATERVRSMAHGLFPAQLNYATLRDALQEFTRQTKTRFRVQFALELPRRIPPHSAEQIIHIYRIAQEAVSNAVRHGHATAIRLALVSSSEGLRMSIEDNGSGFPASTVRPEGIGMHVMQYRSQVLGGSLAFKNLSPRGAAIELAYPVSPSNQRRNRKNARTP